MYLPCTGVPAQDPVVFGTAQQQFRVSLAPRDGQNSPKTDRKENRLHIQPSLLSYQQEVLVHVVLSSEHWFSCQLKPESTVKQNSLKQINNCSSPKSSLPDVGLLKMEILEKAT